MSYFIFPQIIIASPYIITNEPCRPGLELVVPQPIPKLLMNYNSAVISKMQNMRIIQKHLIYLIGLTKELAFKDILLGNFEYLGQYGKIKKLVINKNKLYNGNGPNGPSYSCHVTYSNVRESSLAMLSLDNAVIDNHTLKASYGTTKYCSNFLRKIPCTNKDCLYLHSFAEESDILSRNEMNNNKEIFINQHKMAIELSEILTSNEVKNHLMNDVKGKVTVFPNASSVYEKDIVIKYIEEMKSINKDIKEINENQEIKEDTDTKEHLEDKEIKENELKLETPPPKKKKICCSIMGLDKLYERKEKSRFDFAVNNYVDDKEDKKEDKIKDEIEIPLSVSKFLTNSFKRSILFKKEQDEVSQYYFALNNNKSKDAEDRWTSLIDVLDMYSESENNDMNTIYKNDDIIVVSKFNSA